jgi:hypothetical protein
MLEPGNNNWASRELDLDKIYLVTKQDIKMILNAYLDKTIDYDQLLDLTNLILFNDLFEFDDNAIRNVLDELEESDEDDCKITNSEVEKLMQLLA